MNNLNNNNKLSNNNFLDPTLANPYPDCRPGEDNAKRLSVDIPFEVWKRIKDVSPYRGLWKLYLAQCVHQLDRALQEYDITNLDYPLSQKSAFAVIEQLTDVELNLEKKELVFRLKSLKENQRPKFTITKINNQEVEPRKK